MKPIIYHAVIRVWGGFEIIGVTTEKGRQVYGRRLDESSTHVAARDVVARFPDHQTALSFISRAGKIKAKHRGKIKEAERALSFAHRAEQDELDRLVAEMR